MRRPKKQVAITPQPPPKRARGRPKQPKPENSNVLPSDNASKFKKNEKAVVQEPKSKAKRQEVSKEKALAIVKDRISVQVISSPSAPSAAGSMPETGQSSSICKADVATSEAELDKFKRNVMGAELHLPRRPMQPSFFQSLRNDLKALDDFKTNSTLFPSGLYLPVVFALPPGELTQDSKQIDRGPLTEMFNPIQASSFPGSLTSGIGGIGHGDLFREGHEQPLINSLLEKQLQEQILPPENPFASLKDYNKKLVLQQVSKDLYFGASMASLKALALQKFEPTDNSVKCRVFEPIIKPLKARLESSAQGYIEPTSKSRGQIVSVRHSFNKGLISFQNFMLRELASWATMRDEDQDEASQKPEEPFKRRLLSVIDHKGSLDSLCKFLLSEIYGVLLNAENPSYIEKVADIKRCLNQFKFELTGNEAIKTYPGLFSTRVAQSIEIGQCSLQVLKDLPSYNLMSLLNEVFLAKKNHRSFSTFWADEEATAALGNTSVLLWLSSGDKKIKERMLFAGCLLAILTNFAMFSLIQKLQAMPGLPSNALKLDQSHEANPDLIQSIRDLRSTASLPWLLKEAPNLYLTPCFLQMFDYNNSSTVLQPACTSFEWETEPLDFFITRINYSALQLGFLTRVEYSWKPSTLVEREEHPHEMMESSPRPKAATSSTNSLAEPIAPSPDSVAKPAQIEPNVEEAADEAEKGHREPIEKAKESPQGCITSKEAAAEESPQRKSSTLGDDSVPSEASDLMNPYQDSPSQEILDSMLQQAESRPQKSSSKSVTSQASRPSTLRASSIEEQDGGEMSPSHPSSVAKKVVEQRQLLGQPLHERPIPSNLLPPIQERGPVLQARCAISPSCPFMLEYALQTLALVAYNPCHTHELSIAKIKI